MSDTHRRLQELAPEQQLLVQLLLERRRKEREAERAVIPRRANAGPSSELSFGQQRLWFLDRWDPGSAAYNLPQVVRLSGRLDIAALQRSLTTIVSRHEVLRTSFPLVDGQPVAVAVPELDLPLPVVSLLEVPAHERDERVRQLMREEARRAFDLATGPLLRARLLHLGADQYILLLTIHHIASDGWSNGVLVGEIGALYPAFAAGDRDGVKPLLPPLEIQYADYAAWQRQWLQGEGDHGGSPLQQHLGYWKRQLLDAPTSLALPLDYPRPTVQTSIGARHYLDLPLPLAERLKQLGRQEGASLFMTLLAAFAALLYRYTGQADLLIGSPVANRNRAELEPLIGFFVNTLVLRIDLAGRPSFRQLLRRARDVALGAQDHQDLPFEKLVDSLNLERDMSRNPLFQVMFTLQNAPLPALSSPELTITPLEIDSGAALVDLSLDFYETPAGLRGWFEYNTDLFEAATIGRMAEHFLILAGDLCARPDQPVALATLCSAAERTQVLDTWNATGRLYDIEGPVHTLVEAQAAQNPQAVAIVCGERRTSYAELDARANQIAHRLRAAGLRPGSYVGICAERSPELFACVLGVLKAGGAYVPLDPALPQARLAFVLADTGAALVLAQSALAGQLPEPRPPTIVIDDDAALAGQPTAALNPAAPVSADHPAYVIYTSGSTGQAKGVMVSHRSLCNAYRAWEEVYGLQTMARSHLQMANFSFDVCTGDMVRALCSGGTLVICPRDLLLDPARLYGLLEAEVVACAEFVPAVLRGLLRHMDDGRQRFNHLRVLICGSESWYAHEYQHARSLCRPDARVINSFGLTEATIDSACFEGDAARLPRTAALPIGRPLPNTRLYILDADYQPTPVGVPGELAISGPGLAQGYLNRPDLTAERFVPCPWSVVSGPLSVATDNGPLTTDNRLYRTGDLARYRPDGTIELLGRIDGQLKLRGFRVEPGEIEAVLRRHPAIEAAVVVAHAFDSSDTRLVAYVAPDQEQRTKNKEQRSEEANSQFSILNSQFSGEVRAFLKERLPDYMVPAIVMQLDRMPTTASGKIDRRALPDPEQPGTVLTDTYVTPRNSVEDTVAGIWAEVLEINLVGVYDNFFDLGGHSLLATYVMSRIQNAFQVDLPLRALFDDPTVAGLAARVEAARTSAQGLVIPPIERQPEGVPVPQSLAQERIWLIERLMPGNLAYISTGLVRISGTLDQDLLEAAFNELCKRHTILRSDFIEIQGKPMQVVVEPRPLVFDRADLRHLPPEERERQAGELSLEQARSPLDLGRSPLMRLSLIRMEDDVYLLALATHHIIYDLLSISVVVRELRVLYEDLSLGRPPSLPELPIQFADFAAWQDRWMRQAISDAQLPYWKQQLAGANMVLELPGDRRRPPLPSFGGARHQIKLSLELSKALKKLSTREGATLFMTLLAGFKLLLYRYTGQADMVVGTPTANRGRAEVETLIGFFVNTLALRTNFGGNPTFRELLARVREMALGAYQHQDLPFARLVEELQPARDLSRNPVFQMVFNFLHNYLMPVPDLLGVHVDMLRLHGETEQFDFSLDFWERPDGLHGSFDYATDLFDDATVVRMGHHLIAILTAVAADPDRRIEEIPLLSEGELHQMTYHWNGPWVSLPQHQCIHQLFEAQAARSPQALAVTQSGHGLTYAELNAQANRLAHRLRALGVGPETRVALFVERSPAMLVALLGILKAGGAYVPLDPAYPQERIHYMLEDARVSVLLTSQEQRTGRTTDRKGVLHTPPANLHTPPANLHTPPANLHTPPADLHTPPANSGQPTVIDLDADELLAQAPETNPQVPVGPDNLMYIIYTSGSTGQPKGVMVQHRSACNHFAWMQQAFPLGAGDRVLQCTSFSFDVSVWELFAPLIQGVTLVMARPEGEKDPTELARLIASEGITAMQTVPSLLWMLLGQPAFVQSPTLRLVFCGGEPMPLDLMERFMAGSRAQLNNMYGPTETCIDATAWVCQAGATDIMIGRPVGNAQAYVLDRHMRPMPLGVPGELYIGGPGVARGYLNNPDLTAERFVPCPWSVVSSQLQRTTDNGQRTTDNRLYRTGDLARFRPDGSIEFVGRNDEQIKIRGFRIEPGEIEMVLRRHPAVEEAVVVAREDAPGDKRLIAYIVPGQEQRTKNKEQENETPDSQFSILNSQFSAELRAFLKDHLPSYMVPAGMVFLEALPMLPTGKVDRAALPKPDQSRPELDSGFVAPRSAVEEVLAGIWAEMLDIERVGIYDSFFDLGGHSLLVTQLISQIRELFEIDLALQSIFQEPTVSALAEALHAAADDAAGLEQTAQVILRLAQMPDEEEV